MAVTLRTDVDGNDLVIEVVATPEHSSEPLAMGNELIKFILQNEESCPIQRAELLMQRSNENGSAFAVLALEPPDGVQYRMLFFEFWQLAAKYFEVSNASIKLDFGDRYMKTTQAEVDAARDASKAVYANRRSVLMRS